MPIRIHSRLAAPRRKSRITLGVRAATTHIAALLREFRVPIIGFLVATVGGGIAYGEVYRLIRGEFIPFIDRPYLMVQLMLVEAPETMPPELALVAFWYAMPVVFIVLVGLGAADVLDLFFNREANRDRWAEALAMTYRNHAIGLVDAVMSAADLSAPAFAGAAVGIEITQTIQVAGEEYSSVRLTVHPGSFLADRPVGDLEREEEMEISLVHDGKEVIVDPEPGTLLNAGNEVVIFALHRRALEVISKNRAAAPKR